MTSPTGRVWSSSYWPNGLLHVATLPSGSATYDYDALGRPSAVTYSNAPVTPNVSYSYDADGNRTQMSDGAGLNGVGYAYDPVGNRTAQTRYGAPSLTTSWIGQRGSMTPLGSAYLACSVITAITPSTASLVAPRRSLPRGRSVAIREA